MLRTIVLLLMIMGICGSPVFADESPGHDHTHSGAEAVEEIRVTAHPLSEIEEHIVRPVQVLSKEELRTRSVSSIGETVANELGVTSSDFGTGVGPSLSSAGRAAAGYRCWKMASAPWMPAV